MAKTAWGIEAGTSNVKAVKLTNDGKAGVTLDDVGTVSLAGFRVDGGDEGAALLGALVQLAQEKNIKPNDPVYISLPGRNAFSRVITLPPVGEDQIRETIANEARGQIPIKLEEAVWDYQRISSEETEIQVNLYAVKRDVVDNLVATCKAAGLNVRGIQIAPLGIYNFVKFELDESVSSNCVCIDIGGDNTDLLIIDDERTWIRVIPVAGNDLTKALLMKDKRLKPEMAETLKLQPQRTVKKFNEKGADKIWRSPSDVLEAVKPPLREMVSEINRSIGFYKSQNESADFNKLVLMGNGSKMLNIGKFFGQQLHYDVHAVSELSSIKAARGIDQSVIDSQVQSLVVPIGLALQAIEVPGLATTNLLPSEVVTQEQLAKVRPAALVAGAMVLIGGALSFGLSFSNSSSIDSTIEDVERAKQKANANITAFNELESDALELQLKAETLNNVFHSEDLLPGTYALANDALAHWIKTIEATNPDVKVLPTGAGAADSNYRGVLVEEVSGTWVGAREETALENYNPASDQQRMLKYQRLPYIENPPEDVLRAGRTRRVVAYMNMAVRHHPEKFNDSAMEAAVRPLREAIENRIKALYAVGDDAEARANLEAVLYDKSLIDDMMRLRSIVGASETEAELEARLRAAVGQVGGEFNRSNIENTQKKLESVFNALGGKSDYPSTLVDYETPMYYFIRINFRLESIPRSFVAEKLAAQESEGTEGTQ